MLQKTKDLMRASADKWGLDPERHLLGPKPAGYGGEWADPCSIVLPPLHRDARTLEQSNHEVARRRIEAVRDDLLRKLDALAGKDGVQIGAINGRPVYCTSEDVRRLIDRAERALKIWRARHWAVGWVDHMVVLPDAPAPILREAIRIVQELEAYPALDEDDWREREYEAACELWGDYDRRERLEALRAAGFERLSELKMWARSECPPGEVYDAWEL